MEKTQHFSSKLTDTLLPAVIIREHIQKILQAVDIGTYIADIEKFEDLMATEIDDVYEAEEKKISKKAKEFSLTTNARLNRSSHPDFLTHQESKRNQFKKRLIFRALVRLAKRKGIWLVDEEEAYISHDKKKVTSTGRR